MQLKAKAATLWCQPATSWNYQNSSINLKSGDTLLLFSDGITEAENARGAEFGVERVKTHAASFAAELNRAVLSAPTDSKEMKRMECL